jgi:hypothetical protein
MQPRRLWHLYRFAILTLLAAASAVIPLRAQSPSQDFDDDDEKSTSALSLSVTLSENGKAVVAAYAFTRNNSGDLKPALESAFHCALESKVKNAADFYFGSCTLPASRVGLLHNYRIATKPLLEYALQHGMNSFDLQLTLPDTDVRETIPPSHSTTIPGKTSLPSVNKHLAAIRFFSWPTNAVVPESIEVRVGYEPASVQRNALLLLVALLAPIAFGLWLRRRALSALAPDKSWVWFSYLRYQGWLLNASLVLWWAAEETAHLDGLTRFLFATYGTRLTWLPTVVSSLLTWIPPVVVWIICVVISHPVQEKLRGLQWTRKELVLQAVYSLSSALIR